MARVAALLGDGAEDLADERPRSASGLTARFSRSRIEFKEVIFGHAIELALRCARARVRKTEFK
jgi:hypothetical protein